MYGCFLTTFDLSNQRGDSPLFSSEALVSVRSSKVSVCGLVNKVYGLRVCVNLVLCWL